MHVSAERAFNILLKKYSEDPLVFGLDFNQYLGYSKILQARLAGARLETDPINYSYKAVS